MPDRTIKIDESDYRYLEQLAACYGLEADDVLRKILQKFRFGEKRWADETESEKGNHGKKKRWSEASNRIRKNPPLRRGNDCVWESGKDDREDFSISGKTPKDNDGSLFSKLREIKIDGSSDLGKY